MRAREREKQNKDGRGSTLSQGADTDDGGDEDQYNHTCHRHWAFALFKKGEMAKAIKKIKKAIDLDPKDADNFITWGLIMRTVGKY